MVPFHRIVLWRWIAGCVCCGDRPLVFSLHSAPGHTVPMRLKWFSKRRRITRWSGWTLTQKLSQVQMDVKQFNDFNNCIRLKYRHYVLLKYNQMWCDFLIREWRVGNQTQTSQEGDQHSLHWRWAGVPGGDFLPHHPEKAPLLHHQHHCSLCALLLARATCLLLTC